MKNYIYVKNGKINGCGQCIQLTEGVENLEVSTEVFEEFLNNKLLYVYSNGKIIPNENYENDKQSEFIQQRIDEIYTELENLDIKRIRAVCEDEVKNESTGETWLDYYNGQIYDLRIELTSLKEQL